MQITRIEPSPKTGDLFKYFWKKNKITDVWNGQNLTYMGSGKAAIAIILEYLRSTKELPDKMAEIMVPSWIGNPVYHQINWFGFPTLHYTKKAKAMMVYHQYGFPQDLDRIIKFAEDRNLIIIEDCAHAPKSFYNGKVCGSFGRFAIYSFSKFSFCYALGGVSHKEEQFFEFIQKRLIKSSRISRKLINLLKIIDEANFALEKPLLSEEISVIRKAAYGVYGDAHDPSRRSIAMWQAKREAELERRKVLYQEFLSQTNYLGVCSHLETVGVTPYAIPVRLSEDLMIVLVNKLLVINVRTGINHFDFNRYHVEPDFRKTVLIPCHGDIADSKFSQIIDCVISVTKGKS